MEDTACQAVVAHVAAHPELCLEGATQRGGPELPAEERAAQLAALLQRSPAHFLRQVRSRSGAA
jgi:hypothetical protein